MCASRGVSWLIPRQVVVRVRGVVAVESTIIGKVPTWSKFWFYSFVKFGVWGFCR